MRFSRLFAPTLREVSAEVELMSHRFLLRGGFIRQLAAGIYTFLPLGWRVLNNIITLAREEMAHTGAQEVLLPALQPAELWAESGRTATMTEVLFRVKDRKGGSYVLGPTHEEVVTEMVRRDVHSYRELPLSLYQIQTKYRDEPRPRGGLVRTREFIMKDAYSFDRDAQGLARSYTAMFAAYTRFFQRCGLQVTPVHAGGGAIGGKETMEFMLLSEAGEDIVLFCPFCGYAAHQEIADYRLLLPEPAEAPRPMRKVETPEAHTVQQVCDLLQVPPRRLVKTLILIADGQPVAALVRGDRELNEERLCTLLGVRQLEMATPEQILAATGGSVGFSGPLGLAIPRYGDEELREMVNFVTGANEADQHLVDVNWSDIRGEIRWARLRLAAAGDLCPQCGKPVEARRGMELGHIFKLHEAISAPLHATFTDEEGAERCVQMGCYGIGISRLVAAIAEACHDENGLIWPPSVAPFLVHLINTNVMNPVQCDLAEYLYRLLTEARIAVLYDDRNERAGVKFKDADLIGVPLQVVIGKLAAERQVEFRERAGKTKETIMADELLARVRSLKQSLPD